LSSNPSIAKKKKEEKNFYWVVFKTHSGDMAPVVEHLPSKHLPPLSSPGTAKKKIVSK
jgi:hypothetical protein